METPNPALLTPEHWKALGPDLQRAIQAIYDATRRYAALQQALRAMDQERPQ